MLRVRVIYIRSTLLLLLDEELTFFSEIPSDSELNKLSDSADEDSSALVAGALTGGEGSTFFSSMTLSTVFAVSCLPFLEDFALLFDFLEIVDLKEPWSRQTWVLAPLILTLACI